MNFNQQLAEAYQQGRRQALNEQGGGMPPMMSQMPPQMNMPVPPRNRMGGRGMPQGAVARTDPSMFRGRRPGNRMGGDGFDGAGLTRLLDAWGTDGGGPYPQGLDLNGDGIVDGQDLAIFLSQGGNTA